MKNEAKENLLNAINNTDFRRVDYNILLNLMNNLDSKTFVLLMEEFYIKKELSVHNFYNIINEPSLENEFTVQSELNEKTKNFKEFLNSKKIEIKNSNFLPREGSVAEVEAYYKNSLNEALSKQPETGFENNLINNLNENPTKFILSLSDPLFSVDTNDITLNSFDRSYASANNLTDEECKKIKALAYYLNGVNSDGN